MEQKQTTKTQLKFKIKIEKKYNKIKSLTKLVILNSNNERNKQININKVDDKIQKQKKQDMKENEK